jgi:hypothetical protein
VQAVRPSGSGIPNVSGYGAVASGYGYGNGQGAYCDISQVTGTVTDAQIYQSVAQTVAAGITAWTDIKSATNTVTGSLLFTGTQNAALAVLQDWFRSTIA